MAEITPEVDNLIIQRLVQRAAEQGKENFNESEMLYTIELLEAGLQDIFTEVQGLRNDFKEIEADTEDIKQELHRLHLHAPQLGNETTE